MRFRQIREAIIKQIHNVIIGQDEVIEQVLIALFVGGHCLITGLPGTAKTLLVRTIGQILGLDFKRIQFTPDLMPSDITGTDIIEEDPDHGTPHLDVHARPHFLEHPAGRRNQPYSSQDPIGAARSHAGAVLYGARQSLQDPSARSSCWPRRTRSSWKERIRCPKRSSTGSSSTCCWITLRPSRSCRSWTDTTTTHQAVAETVTTPEEILEFQRLVRMVPIADSVARYAVNVVRATRASDPSAPDFVKKYVNFGASVRAAQNSGFNLQGSRADAEPGQRELSGCPGDDEADSASPHSAQLPGGKRQADAGRHPEEAAGGGAAASGLVDAN